MIDTPRVTRTPAQQKAFIHLVIPRDEIRHVMGPAIGEIFAVLSAQGVTPSGALFCHHLRMQPDIFDFRICVPVAACITASGRVQPGQLPAANVVQTVFHGGYEGLGAAWGEFKQWIAAQGHETRPDLWECYLVGPESSPVPGQWQTQLNQPLAD